MLYKIKKTPQFRGVFSLIGGCDRDRTCDPYDVNVVLIPLSYTPKTKLPLYYLVEKCKNFVIIYLIFLL